MGFLEFYKELEAGIFGAGAKLMGLQFIQMELRLGKTPSRSFRPVKSILKKEKLNGSNFLDWYRNLRIVLRNEQKLHHLEEALPEAPPATATSLVCNATLSLKKNKSQCHLAHHGLKGTKLNKGALDLYVGNGNTAAVEAIGSFDLILPSGMILILDNCHFSPTITRGWQEILSLMQVKELMIYLESYIVDDVDHQEPLYRVFLRHVLKNKASGSTVDFDEIQSEDAQPSENTSLHQHEVEHDTVEPQTDVIPVRRSARIPQAPERYGFYIDAEEHELGDHEEPPNYRAALLDPESKKWLEAINAEM
ncbi:hypothetical protein Tco_0536632 [Tanacetum coccineum]